MKTFLKFRLRPYILAVLFATIFGSIFSSLNIMSRLSDIGAQTTLSDRLSMIFYDLTHFGSLYIIFIAIAFLIAMSVTGLISKIFSNLRGIRYFLAGFIAMIVLLLLMKKAFFDVQIVGGARDTIGLLLQALSGGVAGWLFHRFSDKRLAEKTAEI